MRILKLLFFILFLFTLFCPAQTKESVSSENVTFTSGTFSRPGNNHVVVPSSFQFKFRFLGPNTDVSGLIRPEQLTEGDAVFNCCLYGRRLFLKDNAEGINPFFQGTDPVIVNGTTYIKFFYRGQIRFSGAARVYFYLQKRAVQTVKVPVTMTGFLRGYATLADQTINANPLFDISLDNLKGWSIYTISTHNVPSGSHANHFDVVSVSYEVTP